MWRLRPTVLLAALWTFVSVLRVRRRLRADGVRATSPRAPRLPYRAGLGVDAVITRFSPTCIERALVHQAWLFAQGEPVDVIVGVPRAGMTGRAVEGQSAHAWVDGHDEGESSKYVEMLRLSADRD